MNDDGHGPIDPPTAGTEPPRRAGATQQSEWTQSLEAVKDALRKISSQAQGALTLTLRNQNDVHVVDRLVQRLPDKPPLISWDAWQTFAVDIFSIANPLKPEMDESTVAQVTANLNRLGEHIPLLVDAVVLSDADAQSAATALENATSAAALIDKNLQKSNEALEQK